jgi:hypothetical protein
VSETPSQKPYPGQKKPTTKMEKAHMPKKVKPVLVKTGPRPRVIKFIATNTTQQKQGGRKTAKTGKPKLSVRSEVGSIAKRSGDAHVLTWA